MATPQADDSAPEGPYEFESLEEERLRRVGVAVFTALLMHFGVFFSMALAHWNVEIPPPPEQEVTLIKDERKDVDTEAVKVEPPRDALPDFEDQTVLNEDKTSEAGAPAEMKDFEMGDHFETDDDAETHGAKGDPNALGKLDHLAMEIDNFASGASGMAAIHGAGLGHGKQERYGQRGPGGQKNLTMRYGGNRSTQEAVRMLLKWLAHHQSPDGRWDSDGFDKQCTDGRCTGKGGAEWDVGLTALSLEAFLGHGDSHLAAASPFKENVRRAIDFLLREQKASGCVGDEAVHAYMYNHAIAAYALAEAYCMTQDPRLKEPVTRAVKYLMEAQNPGKGWRYKNYNKSKPDDTESEEGINDTSVTGWAVMALHAAQEAGFVIPPAAYEGANGWLDGVMAQQDDYLVTFGYTKARSFVHRQPYVTTAAGALIRQFTGQNKGLEGAIAKLAENPPGKHAAGGIPDNFNYYQWYYGTLVLFQAQGESWKVWNESLKKAVQQAIHYKEKECIWGSADPARDSAWGDSGGRVYATACTALCMEVYYRYKLLNEAGAKAKKLLQTPPPGEDPAPKDDPQEK